MLRNAMSYVGYMSKPKLSICILILLPLFVPSEVFAEGKTARVSISSTSMQGNDYSSYQSISSDGRYVAFESYADNLVVSDTNDSVDIFVHDRQTGQTTRVSLSSAGVQGSSSSYWPSIASDGRHVTFSSWADNLVADDINYTEDVFVHDMQTGETIQASVSSTGMPANNVSSMPSISSDGRYVAFESYADNLVVSDTNDSVDIFVHDRQTGQTTRVSVSSTGVPANNASYNPSISADGRFVAFSSDADNLVTNDTNSSEDVFVHDRQTGQIIGASVSSTGVQANNDTHNPSISADGRCVAFSSPADNLVTGDTNFTEDIFVRDLQTDQTTRVSVSSAGGQANENVYWPSISSDGRHVAFWSASNNLVTGDTNNKADVFVHDRQPESAGHNLPHVPLLLLAN